MNKTKKTSNPNVWPLILAAVCGLAAGISGELLTRAYFLGEASFPVGQELNLSDLNSNSSNLIIRDPKKVVVNQDIKVSETVSSVSASLVSIFKEGAEETGDPLTSDYYSLEDPLFSGLVMTSDGWALASLSADQREDFVANRYVALAYDRKSYVIDKVVAADDLPGDIVFFHLAKASNLPVRKVAARSDLSLGQSLLAIDADRDVWPTSLASFKRTPGVLSSESLTARLSFSDAAASEKNNSLVFNLAGDLAAMIDSEGEVIPAFAYDAYWREFWGEENLTRPFLGVNYLDLSLVSFTELSVYKGALIYPAGKVAVVKGSPADKADLQAGDIITWINNQEITAFNDLADTISQYEPGDKITVTYIRAGQEKAVDLQLGAAK
jgi:hypothetical protein